MVDKIITYCGKSVRVACDERCDKAWGINGRPKVVLDPDNNEDDYAYLADHELGVAPADPGTYEGDHAKPTTPDQRGNKWCVRECERMQMSDLGESVTLRDFSQRRYNFHSRQAEAPAAAPTTDVGALTSEELRAARALVDAATGGKWKPCGTNDRGFAKVSTAPGDGQLFGICSVHSFEDREANAAFIAASRTLVPRLLDEVERLTKENEFNERGLDSVMTERDFRVQQIENIADCLGDEGEWSNLHDRGDAARDLAELLTSNLERITKERDEARKDARDRHIDHRIVDAAAMSVDSLVRIIDDLRAKMPTDAEQEALMDARHALALYGGHLVAWRYLGRLLASEVIETEADG